MALGKQISTKMFNVLFFPSYTSKNQFNFCIYIDFFPQNINSTFFIYFFNPAINIISIFEKNK